MGRKIRFGINLHLISKLTIVLCSISTCAAICGYESCPKVKDGFLNIHLVPHSHDDVGWLKTVDQYYYGDRNKIQLGAVQYTLDSVVEQLQKSPNRRFIYVETGFFWRWWTNQDDEMKEIVRKLVNSGQLEFINGGWVMNDEAATHYNEIIDQMTLGLRFLNDTFGQCGIPRVAWQIDPFGHSREQASLFAQMGFDGLFFGRLDYQDKFNRLINKNMETIWSASPKNLGKDAWLFTGALFNGYNPPDGFCFDIFCEDDPINDDPKLLGYNLDEKVAAFIKVSKEWATPYTTKNVLMTMGSDFQYMAANTWYKNLDKLIKHVNAKQVTNSSKKNLIYSTPSCYLQEVHRAGKEFSVKTDDFFPYASDPHAFWTGYFTSRPTLKYYVHKTNNFLQVCKQLAVNTAKRGKISENTIEKIRRPSEPLAVAQHHDAVSGTAKQHVTDDYSLRLTMGIRNCEEIVDYSLRNLQSSSEIPANDASREAILTNYVAPSTGNYQFCHQLNISICAASEEMYDFIVSVYNPLARDIPHSFIRIPVSTPVWEVQGPTGDIAPQAVVIPKSVMNIPGRKSEAQYELVFPAGNLPGLSLSNFRLTRINTRNGIFSSKLASQIKPAMRGGQSIPHDAKSHSDFRIENSNGLSILFDGDTGLIKSLRRGNTETNMTQNFYYYKGMQGFNRKPEDRASGAYIFRPNGTHPIAITDKVVSFSVYQGEHVTEVHQVFSKWVSQVIRLYDVSDSVEFEWLVGPIPTEDEIGKEIITRYSSDLNTNNIFFTDANGRELLKRKKDFRPTWNYKVHENVSGNYYPVNSRMIISDNEDLSQNAKTLILLNDRAQGGTSLNDGEMEIMIHRRLLYDDAFGVGEALNEQAFGTGLVARGKHWLVLAGEDTGVPNSIHRPLAQEIFMDRLVAFIDAKKMEDPSNILHYNTTVSALSGVLPPNVHLLTLEALTEGKYLLRLEHIYETGEHPVYSKKISISLGDIQQALPNVKLLTETLLGANQWKSDAKRFDWIPTDPDFDLSKENVLQKSTDTIELKPMQIRTFIASF